MGQIARLNDPSSHNGTIISASAKSLTAGGIAVAVDGDQHSCPIQGHGVTAITGTAFPTSGGKHLVQVGDVAGCGAVITQGIPSVT